MTHRFKRINAHKWSRLGPMIVLSLVMIFKFQNCASGAPPAVGDALVEAGSPVTGIDDVNRDTGVSFVEKSVQVASAAQSFNLDGICSERQAGATLRWDLYNMSGAILDHGFVDCVLGGFQVEVNPAQALNCGEDYRVVAQLGGGRQAQVDVARRCSPVASADASNLKASLSVDVANVSCVAEKLASVDGSCSVVCYENDKVRVEQALTEAACARF